MKGLIDLIVEAAKETGSIEFGGEYHFSVDDSYAVALEKLFKIGCEIGGTVQGNGFSIKVYPCHDAGYYAFHWGDVTKGVHTMYYWTCEQRIIGEGNA